MLAHRRLAKAEAALKKLASPSVRKKYVWLHDYNEACYRKDKGYTRNGLHWGYPEAILTSILGEESPKYYAAFCDKENAHWGQNSRYTKVRYGEVADIVEKGIRQDLRKYKAEVKEEATEYKQFLARFWKKHPTCSKKAVLRFSIEDGMVLLEVLQAERLVQHGFGYFVEKAKPEDVVITPRAYQALYDAGWKYSGLHGVTVFPPMENQGLIIGFAGEYQTLYDPSELCIDRLTLQRLCKV